MHFKVIGTIPEIEAIATGGICEETAMKRHFMICVDNRGYEASLEKRKLYEVLADKAPEKHHQIRVVDESGEDYLYPEKCFAPVRLPGITKDKLELTAA